MAMIVAVEGRTLQIRLVGDIDHHGAKTIMTELERKIECNYPKQLILDMSGVTFMDSSGIAVLLRAKKRLAELDGGLTVTCVPEQAKRVLQAANLHRIIHFE